jgi:hypothetical protein
MALAGQRKATTTYTRWMSAADHARLPTVALSSVVRSAHQGESHGGVYLADFATGGIERVLDWNDESIDWEGRGGDRGLRGIALHDQELYLAASDEIFVYDRNFRRLRSFRNPYLKHCHEIVVAGDALFMTSTGFDSVLEYDLVRSRFVRGYCLRFSSLWRIRRKIPVRPRPSFRVFDPEAGDGPSARDTCHINSVHVGSGSVFVAGTGLANMWRIRDGRLDRFARIPYGSHNARPYRDGTLLNHTRTDRIAFMDRRGRVQRSFPLPRYDRKELLNADLPSDQARPAFGRGLAVVDEDLFVGGSSPATVTLYRFDPPEAIASINVTMDVRNAVHGLELWPFGGS